MSGVSGKVVAITGASSGNTWNGPVQQPDLRRRPAAPERLGFCVSIDGPAVYVKARFFDYEQLTTLDLGRRLVSIYEPLFVY